MADELRTITLPATDLPAFRAAVIACSGAEDRERSERLLGQLASLEAARSDSTLSFVPARGTGPLAQRALAHLRTPARRTGA